MDVSECVSGCVSYIAWLGNPFGFMQSSVMIPILDLLNSSFHWNYFFLIVKRVPANSEHIFLVWSPIPLSTLPISSIKKWLRYVCQRQMASIFDTQHTNFFVCTIANPLLTISNRYTQIYENLVDVLRYWHGC